MQDQQATTYELSVTGMDCAGCARSVKQAVEGLPGVCDAEVYLSAERAVFAISPDGPTGLDDVRRAIEALGYSVPRPAAAQSTSSGLQEAARRVSRVFGLIAGVVLVVVVAGEWLGLLDRVTAAIPWPVAVTVIVLMGYPVFRQVVLAALRKQVISHTLMTVGALAALLAGEWATAAIVVFFMRVGDYAERFTTERARDSIRSLTRMVPLTARLWRDGSELEVPAGEIREGDIVSVRPGEQIPVDGEVVDGHATIDQSAITGESMPVEAAAGSHVFAATIAEFGALRIRADAVGRDTTFGRVIRMVEEAEARRGPVQRLADRFSGYYLPVVGAVAVLTYVLRHDVMATVAVLVVACSCAFALATPVAILASVGAAARRGLLIKGGKYLETLARADVVLIDKTGTLTLGRPEITSFKGLNGFADGKLLELVASAEQYSEHPVGAAVQRLARERGVRSTAPDRFEAVPGQGIRARVGRHEIAVGNRVLAPKAAKVAADEEVRSGRTFLYVDVDGRAAGVIEAADAVRDDVPGAIESLRQQGVHRIELLTGDAEHVAEAVAGKLGLPYRAGLLPEDKIEIVREYQSSGHVVVMIGDGVNDAPALAQADVGIAMGAAGSDVAIEAAHVALMTENWQVVPDLFRISARTMRVVKMNIGFTALYNLAGLSLAALGYLPPVLAAAAQSLPDLGILSNSARLIRQR